MESCPPDTPGEIPCPQCGDGDGVRVLPFSSAQAYVWYLRCAACGHVWTLPKDSAAPPAPLVEV
jgi:uncharacterized Zn finger protein